MNPIDPKHPRRGELRRTPHLKPDSKAAQRRLQLLREPLWEIQPGETQVAYQRFRAYRDQDPLTRTIKRAAEIMGMTINAKHPNSSPSNTLAALSSQNQWVKRVEAYDAWQDTRQLAAVEEAQRAATRSWVARGEAIRQMEYELAMGLADKVREMLTYPVKRMTRTMHAKDGKTTYVTIVEPARWDWKSAAEILKQIGFNARMSAELPTDGGRMASPDPTSTGMSDIDAWLSSLDKESEAPVSSRNEDSEG